MRSTRLQRFTTSLFSALRRATSETGSWLRARPKIAAWLYPSEDDATDARYREFNESCFADFYEQEKMLADRPRMDFYHAAISRHVQPGDRVVDLGTGTGILAAFASRRGASKVYAIDHSSILEHAKSLAAENKIKNVEFVSTHSTAFKLSEPVDVIVHEQMGDWLFDEGMVDNVTDLRERMLKPGGKIVPSCFEFYCEPITLKELRRVPFIWEMNVHGFDYSSMEWSRPQDSEYYRLGSCDASLVDHFLGEPEPALQFDLHTVKPAELTHELRFIRRVTKAGRLDGLAIYFQVRVDRDLLLSSDPLNPGRAPHWGFRVLRTARAEFEVGDEMEIILRIGRWQDPATWRWSYAKQSVPRAQPVR